MQQNSGQYKKRCCLLGGWATQTYTRPWLGPACAASVDSMVLGAKLEKMWFCFPSSID